MRKLFFKILLHISFNYYFQRKKRNRLYILMFHQVNDKGAVFYPAVPVDTFKKICRFISIHHKVIHISEVANHFKNSSEPAFIFSFDDGLYDIIENALPVLSKYNLKFNINIDTEILETGLPQDFIRIYDILNHVKIESYFDDKILKQPIQINTKNPAVTEEEFTNELSKQDAKGKRDFTKAMAVNTGFNTALFSKVISKEDVLNLLKKNVEIGSHSHTHSLLTKISDEAVEYELKHSKLILENIITENVEVLAYPNGACNEVIDQIAISSGYKYLLKTEDRINEVTDQGSHSFFRINQYHQTAEECLANIYGVHDFLRRIKKLNCKNVGV